MRSALVIALAFHLSGCVRSATLEIPLTETTKSVLVITESPLSIVALPAEEVRGGSGIAFVGELVHVKLYDQTLGDLALSRGEIVPYSLQASSDCHQRGRTFPPAGVSLTARFDDGTFTAWTPSNDAIDEILIGPLDLTLCSSFEARCFTDDLQFCEPCSPSTPAPPVPPAPPSECRPSDNNCSNTNFAERITDCPSEDEAHFLGTAGCQPVAPCEGTDWAPLPNGAPSTVLRVGTSSGSQYASISSALRDAPNNSLILVGRGTFTEEVRFPSNRDIWIHGVCPAATEIHGAVRFTGAMTSTLSNVYVTNTAPFAKLAVNVGATAYLKQVIVSGDSSSNNILVNSSSKLFAHDLLVGTSSVGIKINESEADLKNLYVLHDAGPGIQVVSSTVSLERVVTYRTSRTEARQGRGLWISDGNVEARGLLIENAASDGILISRKENPGPGSFSTRIEDLQIRTVYRNSNQWAGNGLSIRGPRTHVEVQRAVIEYFAGIGVSIGDAATASISDATIANSTWIERTSAQGIEVFCLEETRCTPFPRLSAERVHVEEITGTGVRVRGYAMAELIDLSVHQTYEGIIVEDGPPDLAEQLTLKRIEVSNEADSRNLCIQLEGGHLSAEDVVSRSCDRAIVIAFPLSETEGVAHFSRFRLADSSLAVFVSDRVSAEQVILESGTLENNDIVVQVPCDFDLLKFMGRNRMIDNKKIYEVKD